MNVVHTIRRDTSDVMSFWTTIVREKQVLERMTLLRKLHKINIEMSRYLYVMIFRAQNHESFIQSIVKDFQKDVRGTVQTYYRDV